MTIFVMSAQTLRAMVIPAGAVMLACFVQYLSVRLVRRVCDVRSFDEKQRSANRQSLVVSTLVSPLASVGQSSPGNSQQPSIVLSLAARNGKAFVRKNDLSIRQLSGEGIIAGELRGVAHRDSSQQVAISSSGLFTEGVLPLSFKEFVMLFEFNKFSLHIRFELYLVPRYRVDFYQYADPIEPFHKVTAYSLNEARRIAKSLGESYAYDDMAETRVDILLDGKLLPNESFWAYPSKEVVVLFSKLSK